MKGTSEKKTPFKKKKNKRNLGTIPGSAYYHGDGLGIPTKVTYLAYDIDQFIEREYRLDLPIKIEEPNVNLNQWYDLRGFDSINLIEAIATAYGMHTLSIEDALDITQRPKYEEFKEGIFFVAKFVKLDDSEIQLETENLALFFGNHYLISFQEKEVDILDTVKNRLSNQLGRVRSKGTDYLSFAIIDLLVDSYYITIDKIDEKILDIEFKMMEDINSLDKNTLRDYQKLAIEMKRYVVPLKEALTKFVETEHKAIDPSTIKYVRDALDNTKQIIDTLDSMRESLTATQAYYLAEVSNNMNQAFQFLTIITTIFVPISFLAGLYGMNFTKIPGLDHQNGFLILCGFMLLIVMGFLYFFKRKGWL